MKNFFYLESILGKLVNAIYYNNGFYLICSLENLIKLLPILKTHHNFQFKALMDLWCVDYPTRNQRFELNYQLLSVRYNLRLILKTEAVSTTAFSIISFYSAANWLEREVWDMFGVFFYNHTDLRRILTDYGFEGFPLRKEFPVTGYKEVRYDEETKRVVVESLEFTQEMRFFDFLSPWSIQQQDHNKSE